MVVAASAVDSTKSVITVKDRKSTSKTTTQPVFNYDVQVKYEQLIKNPILSDIVKGLLISSTDKMNINPYRPSILKDDKTAIQKAQTHLIDLLKYYEGDRNYYYEAITTPYLDCCGTSTCGFGELTNKYRTQEDAYQNMLKHLEKDAETLKKFIDKNLGKNAYNNLPNSIKEGLLDLIYNKGFGTVSNNKDLLNALADKDYSNVVKNLSYAYSIKDKKQEHPLPGLYRRSLSRLILACRDLSGKERTEAIKEVDNLYNKAKKCFQEQKADTTELDNIYSLFTKGKFNTQPRSAESYKIKIDERFKGKDIESIIRSLYKTYGNTDTSFENFRKEFFVLNGKSNKVKIGQDFKVPILSRTNIPVIEAEAAHTTQQREKTITEENTTPKQNTSFWKKLGNQDKKIGTSIKNFFFGSKKKEKVETTINNNPVIQIHTEATPQISSTDITPTTSTLMEEHESLIEESPLEEIKTPMQNLLEHPSVKIETDGDIELISIEYEFGPDCNLHGLAQDFGTSEAIICSDNNITSEKDLKDGKIHKLKIQKMGYRVKAGETLSHVAKKFGLTLEILKDMNNIDNVDEILADRILELPGFAYKVEKNDTLYSLSKKFDISIEQLMRINNLQTPDIKEGQVLKVIYNDADYSINEKKKKTVVDKTTKQTVQTVDMRTKTNKKVMHKRELLQKKTKINGKVVATRAVFAPKRGSENGPLAGKTIIVNAGHGYSQSGTDIGSKGTHGIEDEWLINYDNAMRLKDQLVAQGARVIFLQGHRRLINEALQRPENKGHLFISVHANSISSSTNDRTQFYYRDKGITGKSKDNSIKFARIAEKKFDEWIPKHEKIDTKDKFVFQNKQDYAQVSINDRRTGLLKTPNKLGMPGIIWEVAFMSTDKGRKRLTDDTLMENYAEVMTQSIVEAKEKGLF